jgi:hypothetical protein
MADYYTRNTKKVLERCANYRKAHPGYQKVSLARYRRDHPALYMWVKAKERAGRKNITFTIEAADIVIPERCPLLGIPLSMGKGRVHHGSPTIDRKIPSLGYVKGNVWVISHHANAVKNDATLEELELLTRNLREELNK